MDPPECSGHSHDHDHGDDLGLSLRSYIDFDRVQCFNEEVSGSGKLVLKIHEKRLSETPSLTSPEGDPELLFYIPFTESVTVQSFSIRSGGSGRTTASPRQIKVFTNRDVIDFEVARELPAQQALELLPPHHFAEGTIDYPTRPAGPFVNITSLAIYIQNNYDDSGESPTEITFLGLKGKGTKMKRVPVEAVYESRGVPKDHKVPDGEYGINDVVSISLSVQQFRKMPTAKWNLHKKTW